MGALQHGELRNYYCGSPKISLVKKPTVILKIANKNSGKLILQVGSWAAKVTTLFPFGSAKKTRNSNLVE